MDLNELKNACSWELETPLNPQVEDTELLIFYFQTYRSQLSAANLDLEMMPPKYSVWVFLKTLPCQRWTEIIQWSPSAAKVKFFTEKTTEINTNDTNKDNEATGINSSSGSKEGEWDYLAG